MPRSRSGPCRRSSSSGSKIPRVRGDRVLDTSPAPVRAGSPAVTGDVAANAYPPTESPVTDDGVRTAEAQGGGTGTRYLAGPESLPPPGPSTSTASSVTSPSKVSKGDTAVTAPCFAPVTAFALSLLADRPTVLQSEAPLTSGTRISPSASRSCSRMAMGLVLPDPPPEVEPPQELRRPPVGPPGQLHRRRNERGTDEEGVDQHRQA